MVSPSCSSSTPSCTGSWRRRATRSGTERKPRRPSRSSECGTARAGSPTIRTDQRRIDSFVEAYHISHELAVIWLDKLDQASDDAESEHLYADLTEVHRAYEALLTEYQRLVREAEAGSGAGLLGAVASLAVHFVGASVAGPIIGTAVSSGFDRAINGGSLPEVIFAMGVPAGATFAARLAGAEMVGELSERGFADANAIVVVVVVVVSLGVLNVGDAFTSDVLDAPSDAISAASTPASVWPPTSATKGNQGGGGRCGGGVAARYPGRRARSDGRGGSGDAKQ